jgi:RNA polymerase sigma-70 factor (sigma-E family)
VERFGGSDPCSRRDEEDAAVTPPDGADWEREFVEFVNARARVLRNTAYLLSGDWHLAEDVTQAALVKLYRVWRRIGRAESVDAYARRVVVRTFLDDRRRSWRRERTVPALPDRAGYPDPTEDRLDLLAALARLPGTQRAAVVLRYWSDLSIAETADALGVSEGTVKSASSRGLAALREVLQGSRRDEPAVTEEWV